MLHEPMLHESHHHVLGILYNSINMKPQVDKTNIWRQKSKGWLGGKGMMDLEEAEGNSWGDRNVLYKCRGHFIQLVLTQVHKHINIHWAVRTMKIYAPDDFIRVLHLNNNNKKR